MDENEIVRKFIAGSATIDRMRDEIDLVVSSVLGLVTHDSFAKRVKGSPECSVIVFGDAGCSWEIRAFGDIGLQATCRLSENILGYATNGLRRAPVCNAAVVHRSLPTFVLEMMEIFPELEGRLQPFLNAADLS